MARPPKYTLEEFQEKLQAFWTKCGDTGLQPTKEQLVVFLEIHKDTYNEWKKETHSFSDSLKRVEAMIEGHIVEKLLTGSNTAGVIFYLKNAFGWRDKNETDMTLSGSLKIEGVNISVQ